MKNKIFISYSHKDKLHKERLETHLKSYVYDGDAVFWSDSMIQPGELWEKRIESEIGESAVAILLLSANFLASEFIRKKELPLLLKEFKEKGVPIICVYVNDCNTPDSLKQFQFINSPDQPVARYSKDRRERVWDRLAKVSVSVANEYQKTAMNKRGMISSAVVLAGAVGILVPLAIPLLLSVPLVGALSLTLVFQDLFSEKRDGVE